MHNRLTSACILLFTLVIGIISGCSRLQQQATMPEDSLYLTPVPESTLFAIQVTPPVTTKLEAVILARKELATTRLVFTGEPIVVRVEEMNYDKALQQVSQDGAESSSGLSSDSIVWLVTFEGEIQVIFDPLRTITPESPAHRCAFVIINASNGQSTGVTSKQCPGSP